MALSEAQEVRNDVIEAINTYGSDVVRHRQAYQDGTKWINTAPKTMKVMPDFKDQAHPNVMQAYGITNQSSLENHDIFYCLPDADIREQTDTIFFDGANRGVAQVKTFPVSNVNIVKIIYVLRESKNT